MPAITQLEQVLRRPDGHRHAIKLQRLLRRRRERLLQTRRQALPQEWDACQRLAAACEAAEQTVNTLYRRYHNKAMEEEEYIGESR
ncbi:EscE/YscE/SsaE family type III secretion system needle protein co-chaperone [Apirhabdus apintestini]|uniref:EscE/YscE/SsaE family type III secretion system needle protein co-chaperone n=1 Tax=Erwinia sp. HR93 TaxID=3094840 RepID=UPI002ADEE742|nr:EscE/YscE/SsaE family type III secretion system needle protein co-chaperone [Erwinia sp. HR93]MEA1063780.1 EscE/YscE/SsaE family type III secretion system needle protein co-chaperone [Erwinia sp. HR93]WPM84148.1 EscE/YscE/SsaE family type III secretion system needle protein co-chaperone [Enterobacteriaceae bacterium CA-0114]